MTFTVKISLTYILHCDAGPAAIRTVCKYGGRFLSRILYIICPCTFFF